MTVSATREHDALLVEIEDKDIGIEKKEPENIFERFYRVKQETMKQQFGLGLGLYIAAEIIQKSGGEIGVRSKPGEGALFYFRLPMWTN